MRHATTLVLTVATMTGLACTETSTAPARPSVPTVTPALSRNAVLTPSYDLDVVLSSAPDPAGQQGNARGDHQDGSGSIAFRQPGVPAHVVSLDTHVRDLIPLTAYELQRANDGTVDGQCTGTNWLTLGRLMTPLVITTDSEGNGQATFTRDLSGSIGKSFDIHFRVIKAGAADPLHPDVVLASGCYQFVVR